MKTIRIDVETGLLRGNFHAVAFERARCKMADCFAPDGMGRRLCGGWHRQRIAWMKVSKKHSRRPASCRQSLERFCDDLYLSEYSRGRRRVFLDGHLLYTPTARWAVNSWPDRSSK